MTHERNEQSTDKKQNLARFFIEQRHVAWVSLAVALLWGIYGLLKMPQRKDPDIPVRQAMVIVPWQGTSAEQVEQLVTRKVEQALASNQWVTEMKSASRTGSAMVQFELAEKGKYDRDKELDDIKIRLDSIHDLPQGAGPILYIKDFGDTSALMLTVASPPADPVEVTWVSKLVEAQIRQVRSGLPGGLPDIRSSVSQDQLLAQDIKRAVDEQLAQRGLSKVGENGDLQVSYQAVIHEEKSISLSGMGGTGWGAGPGWSGFDSVQGQTSTIPIGTLVVGLYDAARKQLIWRGDASKTVDVKKDPNKNYQILQKAMAKLFKNYPPQPNK
jgi:hypothetical protein